MTPLGQLFLKYHRATNPVTRAVYAEIISKRLNRIEAA